jgi:hypothetical protein
VPQPSSTTAQDASISKRSGGSCNASGDAPAVRLPATAASASAAATGTDSVASGGAAAAEHTGRNGLAPEVCNCF